MHLKHVEPLATKYFLATVVTLLTSGWLAYIVAVLLVGVSPATEFVDGLFKIAAVIAGTLWALNRYFAARTDILQLRVDPTIEFVGARSGISDSGVLLCRLDIVNTGKSLTSSFTHFVQVDSLEIEGQTLTYTPLGRWPVSGVHGGSAIEPGAWSAVSLAMPLPTSVRAVRVFLEVAFEQGARWTWHRSFPVGGQRASL